MGRFYPHMTMVVKKIFYWGMYYICPFFEKLTDRQFKKENIRKIMVIGIGEIGDILRLFPFLTALRKKMPDVLLSMVTTLKDDHGVWTLLPKSIRIDEKIFLDLKGTHKGILSKIRLVYSLRKKGFDLIIDTSRGDGMGPNSIMSFLIGSRNRVGFIKNGIGFLHTIKVKFSEDEYIGRQNLKLLDAIGIPESSSDIKIRLSPIGQHLEDIFFKLPSPVVVMHPAAKWNGWQRCWPPNQYAELTKMIIKEYSASVIILGDILEKKIAGTISSGVRTPNLVDLTGKTTLSEAAAIIKRSNIFIGNDSSLLHLAVGLKTPAVGIFGPTSPKQVLPESSYVYTVRKNIPCSPCYTHQPLFLFNKQCDYMECLLRLSVEDVMVGVRTMINRSSGILV